MQTVRVIGVLVLVGLGILGYAVWGRSGRETPLATISLAPQVPIFELTAVQPVKDIELEQHPPDMPPGPGHEAFVSQCVICHSPRYVLNQPVFPRKTWAAEVHKMVKSYGAPIPLSEEKELTDYLVTWHGTEDPPAAPTQNAK
jgi:mono/diheme cytochrome c family protein